MSNTSKSQTVATVAITLAEIQSKLNVPKKHWNKYGEFYYRNIDDILEAVKPVLKDHGFYLILTDDIMQVGEFNYIKSIATISNGSETYSASGLAREIVEKKKMDSSQLTGVASAYARKVALSGLFGLDDNQDADSDKIGLQEEQPAATTANPVTKQTTKSPTDQPERTQLIALRKELLLVMNSEFISKEERLRMIENINDMTAERLRQAIAKAKATITERSNQKQLV